MRAITVCVGVLSATLFFSNAGFAQRVSFDDVVKRIEAKIDPVTAKRGETVKWKLAIELIEDWHTYPTKQLDPKHESYVNKIKFANTPEVVFVGEVKEPELKVRLEEGAKLGEVEGLGIWGKAVVIRPDAKPGKVKITVPVTVQVCDKNGCLPPKKLNMDVELTISDAPAVAVDEKYRKEVEAAPKK